MASEQMRRESSASVSDLIDGLLRLMDSPDDGTAPSTSATRRRHDARARHRGDPAYGQPIDIHVPPAAPGRSEPAPTGHRSRQAWLGACGSAGRRPARTIAYFAGALMQPGRHPCQRAVHDPRDRGRVRAAPLPGQADHHHRRRLAPPTAPASCSTSSTTPAARPTAPRTSTIGKGAALRTGYQGCEGRLR